MRQRDSIRVLYLDHVSRLSGAEQSLSELVIGLSGGPVEPIVVLPSDGPLAVKLREHGILVRKVPMNKRLVETSRRSLARNPFVVVARAWAFLVASWRIYGIVREMRPDVIHSNTLKTHFLAIIPAKLARIPLVWHVRDILPKGWLRKVFVFFARVPKLIVVPSRSVAQGFGRKRKKIYKKLRLIPNGVRVDEIYEGVQNGAGKELRREIGANGAPVVGIVGRIAPWKGQEVFVRAAAMLADAYPKVRFAVIGAPMFGGQDVQFQEKLQDLVAEAGLSDRIVFLGWRSTVEAMSAIDILVHASLEPEPFGRTIIESMAAGNPVVAGASGAIRELVPPEAGIVIPPGRPEILADALDTLLSDKEMRLAMGEAGLSIAHGYFDVRRTVAGVGAMYSEITRKRRPEKKARRPLRVRKARPISWPTPKPEPLRFQQAAERFDPQERFEREPAAYAEPEPSVAPAPRRSRQSQVRRLVARVEPTRESRPASPVPVVPSARPVAEQRPEPLRPAARAVPVEVERSTTGNGHKQEGNGSGNGNGNGNGHTKEGNGNGKNGTGHTAPPKRSVAAAKTKANVRRVLPDTSHVPPKPPALRREAPVPVERAEKAVPIRVVPEAPQEERDTPRLPFERKPVYEFLKRLIDIAVAGLVLIVGAPIWITVAIFIKLDTRGPVLFRNTVIGRDSVPFTYYKFRSMRIDLDDAHHREFIANYVTKNDGVEHGDQKVFKLIGDPRVTRMGRWIRKLSIDEVPQLFNVLKGEMSIVGPRPPLAYEFELYDGYAKQRLSVPPGLTGLQQVEARHTASFKDKIEMDLDYIRRRSVVLDLVIMLKSIPAALRGE